MGLSTLLVVAAYLASAASSPIFKDIPDDDLLPFAPAGAIVAAADDRTSERPSGTIIWAPRSVEDAPQSTSPDASVQPQRSQPPPIWAGSPPSIQPGSAKGAPQPTDSPMPFWPGSPMKAAPSSDGSCTSIMAIQPGVCSWNGVMTIYPSTTTAIRQVNCNGCAEVSIPRQIYNCPNQVIHATETAPTPSTRWSTICSPTPALAPRSTATAKLHQEAAAAAAAAAAATAIPTPTALLPGSAATALPPATLITAAPPWSSPPCPTAPWPRPTGSDQGSWPFPPPPPGFYPPPPFPPPSGGLPPPFAPNNCWTPFVIQPHMTAGKTSIEYQETRTTTCELQCDGCALATSLAKQGYGPPVRYRTTITKPYYYTTVYRCSSKS